MNKLLFALALAAALVVGFQTDVDTEAALVAQPDVASSCELGKPKTVGSLPASVEDLTPVTGEVEDLAPAMSWGGVNLWPQLPLYAGAAVNRAALVVTFEDGHSQTFCIKFTEDFITGLELLRRSGLPLVTSGNGGLGLAVCSIDGEGCDDPGACFCKIQSGGFWVYFQYQSGGWAFSQIGASSREVRDGDADGWSWGSGPSNAPDESPDCAEPTPTPSPLPTSTPRPTRTPSPDPSATPPPPAVVPPTAAAQSEVLAEGAVPPTAIPGAATPSPRLIGTPPPTTPSPGAPTAATMRTRTATITPTASTGVIRVSPDQGEANARASAGDGGGSPWGLLTFAAVAIVLVGAAGVMFVRRRPHGHQ